MIKMQTFFIALADKTRRRILNLLRERELSVYSLTEVLNISQPKISRHLAYLRKAQIVSTRREGKWMFYSILEPEESFAAQILQNTLEWLESDEIMLLDYQKLMLISAPQLTATEHIHFAKPHVLLESDILRRKQAEMEIYLL